MRALLRSLQRSYTFAAALVLLVAPLLAITESSLTPNLAGAVNSAESDCLSIIGGSGHYGSNYSYTAACEHTTTGDTAYKIAGVNTTSKTFSGHLEFFYLGRVTNFDSGDSWGAHGVGFKVSDPATCPTGTATTILWRHNSGTNYTNMGEAVISYVCAGPNQPTRTAPPGFHVTVTQNFS